MDNGEFLRNLTNQLSKADELYLSAKQKDHRGDDEKKVVKAYQTAYLAYVELQRIQKRASAKIEHLKNKQKSRSIWHIVWNVISVIGVILTILQFFGIYIKIWN